MDVAAWLRDLGLERYEQAFRDNAVGAEVLPDLSEADLEKLGVLLGHRKKLLKAIAALAGSDGTPRSVLAIPVAAPSLAAREAAQAERRQLTVMFVDLVGSTALASRLDPEETREIIRAYQDRVTDEILRYEGYIAKFMGDGVLAYFGWPKAHEDEAERAVRAGLAIVRAVGRLATPTGGALAARVGIATGLVVVGDLLGEGAAREEAVVGETPNLAARLQELAEPGTVIVADATRRLVGGLFDLADLGPRRLKGIDAPSRVFVVRGERPVEDRFEARQAGALLSLVGRDQELALLLDRWRLARGGEGQTVLLSGEAGIGKSRIVLALRERLRSEPRTSVRYNCSPFHANSALHPAIEQLIRAAGFGPGDDAATKLAKLDALIARVTAPDDVLPYLIDLLGLPLDGHYALPPLTPQERKARTFRALLAQLEGLAEQRPVLLVLEDAHWCDPTTLELFDRVVERVASLPALLVVTFRPEFRPPWAGHAHVTSLALNRLGRAEAGAIVGRVAGGRELPAELLDAIVARTDGVPLFVEELTKAVLESGLLREEDDRYALAGPLPPLAIPSTLHDSLMARLDRLAPVREVAQVGAVIGREFSHALLAAVAGMDGHRLADALDQLVGAELIFRRGSPTEPLYAFKHALVQDAAYQSLLKSRRQELHAQVADALEREFHDVTTSRPELLAHHCAHAGRTARAIELWRAAGERALARAANREAAAFLERALAALGGQAETPEVLREVIDIRRLLHQALYPIGELRRTRANLAEAERLAERLDDPVRLCRILSSETYLLAASGDLAGAIGLGERALALLGRGGNDLEGAVNTRLMLARALYASGRYREAIGHAHGVVAILGEDVERGSLGGINQTVNARVWLVLCHAELGEFEASVARGAEALRLAERVAGEHERLWARLGIGRLHVLRGDFHAATEVLEPALPLCEGEFAIHLSRVASSLGVAYAASGRPAEGLALLERAADHARAIGFLFGYSLTLSQLGRGLLLADQRERALAAGSRALEVARQAGERGNEAWALHLLGDLAASGRDHRMAEERYREALTMADRMGMAPVRARCLEGLRSLTDADDHRVPHTSTASVV